MDVLCHLVWVLGEAVCPCVTVRSYVACQCAHARVNVACPKVAAVGPVPSDQEECMHSLDYAGQSDVVVRKTLCLVVQGAPLTHPGSAERPHGRTGVPGSCGVFVMPIGGCSPVI